MATDKPLKSGIYNNMWNYQFTDSFSNNSPYAPAVYQIEDDSNHTPIGEPRKHTIDNDNDKIFDTIAKYSKISAGFDLGMSALSAAQGLLAKEPTVTKPQSVRLQRPKIRSSSQAALGLSKERAGTAVNSYIEAAKERGVDPSRNVSIFAQANELMRQDAARYTKEDQNLINQGSIIMSDIANKEAIANTEITNRYIERKDQILAEDAAKRGAQVSQAVSNVGQIADRLMNDQLTIEQLKHQRKMDEEYAALYERMMQYQGIFPPP